ncbi:MAG: bis(5'-nucleosyl)-tetraphosphatase (symmetrical) YqeK [Lachnospiraceae bacterium]|nr:bis(5'-nucleosyl)-tetraphosphatase (symmetrical) YqeK [Lachnospiraceae bacterium]
MKATNLAKLRKEMEQTLERKRYEHTLGVAYTAANLAMIHGVDVEKALTAGMLHDCAKCMSHHKQLSLCRKNKIVLSEIETENHSPLLHAKAGSCLARKKYGITDEEILQAISYHTTGRPHMSPLEKIIYIADYIEPGRERAKRSYADVQNLQEVRKMAYQDLDRTLCKILNDTLDYLSRKGGKIDSMTRDTYEYYCQIRQ